MSFDFLFYMKVDMFFFRCRLIVMIRYVNIVGAQCNGTHAQHGQRPREWGPTQYKYYCSVKYSDPAALIDNIHYHNMNGQSVVIDTNPTKRRYFTSRVAKFSNSDQNLRFKTAINIYRTTGGVPTLQYCCTLSFAVDMNTKVCGSPWLHIVGPPAWELWSTSTGPPRCK